MYLEPSEAVLQHTGLYIHVLVHFYKDSEYNILSVTCYMQVVHHSERWSSIMLRKHICPIEATQLALRDLALFPGLSCLQVFNLHMHYAYCKRSKLEAAEQGYETLG